MDLTDLILRENNMTVNEELFNAEMQQQKPRARNAAAVEATDWVELREGVTEFVGYDLTECDTEILRYRQVKQHAMPPMARINGDRCGGCNMSLPAATRDRLNAGNDIVECDNCGRILFAPSEGA